MNAADVKPGLRITVTYRAEHHHAGTVLARNDPRAWAGSLAFGARTPTQEEVDAHLAKPQIAAVLDCEKNPKLPVLWDFGKLYWEPISAMEYIKRDWRVLRVVDSGKANWYRYHVEGENLNYPLGHMDRKFSWAVPGDPREDPRYDVSRAIWEERPAVATAGGGR